MLLKEVGVVEEVRGEEVVVRLNPGKHCESCEAKGICHPGQNQERLIIVKNFSQLSKGEVVEIGIPEKELLKISFLVYILPILSMIVFSTLSYYFLPQLNLDRSLCSFIIGILALFFTYFPLRKIDKARRSSFKNMPRVLRTIPPSCNR